MCAKSTLQHLQRTHSHGLALHPSNRSKPTTRTTPRRTRLRLEKLEERCTPTVAATFVNDNWNLFVDMDGSGGLSRHRRQERHPPCPKAQLRHGPAIRRRWRPVHRSSSRSRVPGVNAPLPARRPRTQAEGARPDRPAAYPNRPLHAPGQAPRLSRKPVRLCRTTRRGHRPGQQRNRRQPRTSA